ncbi:hypothetical protein [Terriglobus aquaticus]|uniref:Uncharacterized protein n=1 Tax=Terriglobus aquaticus TaxID=940139 RepID=A0ABW9KFK1_9BACT|nr:hypothetical protein [Terriglobus aquaticus]
MRISFDFGDGNGPVDYTATLVAPPPAQHSNASTTIETFRIERKRGQYARCFGTVEVGTSGLEPPQQGCRVTVHATSGAQLFSGVIVSPAVRAGSVLNGSAPVAFEAMEDAYLVNIAPDVSLQPTSSATHPVAFSENAIVLQPESAETAGERATDVLVTGAEEPTTYVTELFQGDGTTATFALTAKPFVPSGQKSLIADSFIDSQFRSAVWRFADTGQHIGLGSGGLRITGGNGFDGQTYMAAQQPVEMGGTLCAEMRGLVLQPGSAGVLLGMYGNVVTVPTCFAGVQVNASGGAQSLSALVNGSATGTPYNWATGHSYTLRVRLHCGETQRVLGSYQALVNGAVETWGGGLVDAPMQMMIEVLDEGLASSTRATVLYAGAVSSSIASAVFAPVNSQSLVMTAAAITLQQQGSAWVATTQTDGSVQVRRPGTPETGEDYRISGTSLEFFAGREPAAGALVTATYRLGQRSQARVQSATATAQRAQMGLPGFRTASSRVTDPQPRSSADCAAAAQALLGFYGSPAFGVRGKCSMANAERTADVQPGDAVALPVAATPVSVPVTRVTIRSGHSVPETLEYAVDFEQAKSNGLSFRTEMGAAADAALPAPVYAVVTTASLPQLAVTVAGTTSLQVDAGTIPPVGGGFEVRRHDGGWGPDQPGAAPDGELVLRSPVRSFSIPRAAFAERFYVRMYDGSETPVYSGQSSLICTHLPTG